MDYKKYVKFTISLTTLVLLIIVTTNILVDPLFQYHKPWFGFDAVVTNERYQVAGMAKTFNYDNCILGNSLSENFKSSTFEKKFEGDTIKLAISGSVAKDWSSVLEVLKTREEVPSRIFSNIDPFTLSYAYDKSNANLPMFLYDDNYLNDCNYLLNFEVFFKYTFGTILDNISNNVPDLDTAFLKNNTGRDAVLKNYTRSEIVSTDIEYDEIMYIVQKNIDLLKPHIELMSDTEFHFFFTPFSLLYWDNVIREKKDIWWYEVYNLVCEELLEYENVKIYLWNDSEMFSMMSDLDNYIDSAHYGTLMCEKLVERMADEKGLLSKSDYKKEIDKLFEYIRNYDFDSILR